MLYVLCVRGRGGRVVLVQPDQTLLYVARSVVDIVVFIGYIGDICRCFMFCMFLAGEKTRRPRCSSAARPPPDTRQTKLIRLIPTPAPIPATRLLRISRK